MATFSVTNTFVVNTRARSAEVNANFNDVLGILSAHHHDPNIYVGAKPVTNSGIAANAQIADTQLKSQITRSGLINQSSLNTISQPGIIAASAIPGTATNLQVFTSDGTWSKQAGVTFVVVEMWGGGGSGGRQAWVSGADGGVVSGGGGGEYAFKVFLHSELTATVAVTVGEGGAAKSSDGAGNTGEDSTFGAYLTAKGGPGGYNNVGSPAVAGGVDGGGEVPSPHKGVAASSGTSINGIDGGGAGGWITSSAASAGGSAVRGGGGGGSANENGNVSIGGISKYGGDGGDGKTGNGVNGEDGETLAGGGGAWNGTVTGHTANSGAGGRGEVRVYSW